MFTEKYAEQNSIASKIAGTVTSYRITLLDNGRHFQSICLWFACVVMRGHIYARMDAVWRSPFFTAKSLSFGKVKTISSL